MLQNPRQESASLVQVQTSWRLGVQRTLTFFLPRSYAPHLNYTNEVPCSQQRETGTFMSSKSHILGADESSSEVEG